MELNELQQYVLRKMDNAIQIYQEYTLGKLDREEFNRRLATVSHVAAEDIAEDYFPGNK